MAKGTKKGRKPVPPQDDGAKAARGSSREQWRELIDELSEDDAAPAPPSASPPASLEDLASITRPDTTLPPGVREQYAAAFGLDTTSGGSRSLPAAVDLGELPTTPEARAHQRTEPHSKGRVGFPPELSPVHEEFADLETIPVQDGKALEAATLEVRPGTTADDYIDVPTVDVKTQDLPPPSATDAASLFDEQAEDDDEFGDAPTYDLPNALRPDIEEDAPIATAPLAFELEPGEEFVDLPTAKLDPQLHESAQASADDLDPFSDPLESEADELMEPEPVEPAAASLVTTPDGDAIEENLIGEPIEPVAAPAVPAPVVDAAVEPAAPAAVSGEPETADDEVDLQDEELDFEETGTVVLVAHPSVPAVDPTELVTTPMRGEAAPDEEPEGQVGSGWVKATRRKATPDRDDVDDTAVAPPPEKVTRPQAAAGSAAQPAAEPKPGRPFGRYRLLRRLKAGGMGEVYQAVTTWGVDVERQVAIKRVLLPLIERKEFVRRFIDEARLMVQLNHRAIVQLLEFGTVNDEYFIAMEYVHGRDLDAIMKELRERVLDCPVDVAVYVVRQLLDGLDHAHRAQDADGQPMGIVHRDISPPNILCGFDGHVKLTDFGIARAAGKRSLTAPGQLVGKFAYMSPEQIEEGELDRRSDVFSAGIILHELISGGPLFLAKTELLTMQNVRGAPIASLRKLRPTVTPELDAIVQTALQRDPEQRFQWASEMGEALQQILTRAKAPVTALETLLRELFKREAPGRPISKF